jgi:hypothetical protein
MLQLEQRSVFVCRTLQLRQVHEHQMLLPSCCVPYCTPSNELEIKGSFYAHGAVSSVFDQLHIRSLLLQDPVVVQGSSHHILWFLDRALAVKHGIHYVLPNALGVRVKILLAKFVP